MRAILFLLYLLGVGSVHAQSNLPACVGSAVSSWSGCQGAITFANGGKYVGEFQDGKYSGQGRFTTPGGNDYFGEFKGGIRHGRGTFTFPLGNKYVGEVKDGKYDGLGIDYNADGGVNRSGQWLAGALVQSFALDTNRFPFNAPTQTAQPSSLPLCSETGFQHNCYGTRTYPNGGKYVGEFKDSKRNGQGTFTFRDGDKYVGEFRDDKFNGEGIDYRADGSIIRSGQWIDGSLAQSFPLDRSRFPFHAPSQTAQPSSLPPCPADANAYLSNCRGTHTSATGRIYSGEYRDGRFVGSGDNARVDIQIRNGMANGQGTITFANGDKYVGEFKDSKYSGEGTLIFANGGKYVGEYRDNKRNGRGIEYRADGTIIRSGQWTDGNLAQSFALDTNRFPFSAQTQTAQLSSAERERMTAEAQATRQRQQELEERLAAQAAEAEAAKRRQQELEAQLVALQSTLQAPPALGAASIRSAHALVIGNAAYPGSGRLDNPVNDAIAISNKLRSMGFTVTTVTDANRQRLVQAMAQFRRSAASADLSLLFYSGHGVQIFGTNYILPTDVDQTDTAQATIQGVPLNQVIENFMPGKTKIVFLDACRDNPLQRTGDRSVTKGLAPISVSEGTLISYATKDGQVAADGVGSKNSPFTQALLEHLADPQDIGVVLRKVREKVMRATGGKQQPWDYGSLTGGELVLSAIRPRR